MNRDLGDGALVELATAGDGSAWEAIVDRYAPLVWSIARRHGLAGADADDVGQTVWLRLLEALPSLRERAALPGWLATTTRRECLRLVTGKRGRQRLELLGDVEAVSVEDATDAIDDLVLAAERQAVLTEAFATLPREHRELMRLLLHDPPLPYVEIGRRLGIPVGSIGPTRRRCIDKLRRDPALAALDAPAAAPVAPAAARRHHQRPARWSAQQAGQRP
jgi:RNA polymerase sigma factor (sigma-70 family)